MTRRGEWIPVAAFGKLDRYGAEDSAAPVGVVSNRGDFRVTPEEAGGPA